MNLMKDQKKLTKEYVNEIIEYEKRLYFPDGKITLESKCRKTLKWQIFSYLKLIRQYEYVCVKRDATKNFVLSKVYSIFVKICDRKKNIKGTTLGLEIMPHHVGRGIKIFHQNVIINGYVGENCIFHGHNVLGNKKTGLKKEIPVLGNNVDVGVGAIVIGNVKVADNCVIGAGAVVTKSFPIPGTIIAGVPAKAIGNIEE